MGNINWIIHAVMDSPGPGGIVNSHTHGMEQYGHLDFQLVLPLVPKQISFILNSICLEVQNGKRFSPGSYRVEGFTCDFRFELHKETGRDVLRLIIPDPKFRFPEDPMCEEPYKYQIQRAFEL